MFAENVGQRLENFFWRIWSSERLRQRLSGVQVNIQFDIINEGGYLRTTPTSSPRSSKSLSAYYKEARRRTPPTTPPAAASPQGGTPPEEASSSSSGDHVRNPSASIVRKGAVTSSEKKRNPKSSPEQSDLGAKAVTPRKSSLPALVKSREVGSSPGQTDPEDASVTPTPPSPLALIEQSEDTSKENRRTPQAANWRPPILKKGSSGSSRSTRSIAIAFTSADSSSGTVPQVEHTTSFGEDSSILSHSKSSGTRRPTATRFNEEVAVSIPKPSSSSPRAPGERLSRLGVEGSQKTGKRNPVVVASSAVSKTKPTFSRQRSNIGSSKDVPSRSSSYQNLARSPKSLTKTTSTESRSSSRTRQSSGPSSTRSAHAASPHPSKQCRQPSPDRSSNEDKSEESECEQSEAKFGPQVSPTSKESSHDVKGISPLKTVGVSKPLVDPNFRAKFIDRTKASQRSMTDISAFARKASTAVPTSASYQASGMMESVQATSSKGRGKGREAFTNVIAPLKAPAPAGPEVGSDDPEEPLPRTKSQLTLLLEKEKTRSEREERHNKKPDS